MIKGVVFDLDNTLYDYDNAHELAMHALAEYACNHYKITKTEFDEAFNKAKCDIKNQLGNVGASHNRMLYMQLFLEQLGKKPVVDALELYDIYWNTFLNVIHLFPFVKPLFTELKSKNISIYMLTDLTAHIQHRKLSRLGIAEYIDAIVSSEEAGAEKPDRIAFERLLSKTTFAPEELIMIGDSLEKDIKGAEKCGMHAIHFCKEYKNDMNIRSLELINELDKLG